MTDKTASEDPITSSDETTHLPSQSVHLKFPTIDLNTSLESLLSYSTPTTSEASTIMATLTAPPPAMDESWASLDISELPHDDDDDDDTQSVNSDTGSLVDLSSVHDTESVAEDESQDELGIDTERVTSMLKRGFSGHSEQVGQPDEQDLSSGDSMQDTIIMQQSTIQSSMFSISMEYSRQTALTPDPQSPFLKETMTMKISPKDLKPFDTPVRICYYGSPYCSNSKDELLGKIGAALLAPASDTTSQTPTSSTCFNIVPTEFGPGSKPAFADLIPSQTQMTVDELSVVLNPSDQHQHDTMHFALRRGIVLDSMLGRPLADSDCKDFRPDLLVIHLSEKDVRDRGSQFAGLRTLAYRHCWPTIVVADDDSFIPSVLDSVPRGYGIQVSTESFDGIDHHHSVRPIDLDTFMALDTAQLSRHIRHVMDHNYEMSPTQEKRSFLGSICVCFFNAYPRQYIVKLNQGKSKETASPSSRKSWFGEATQIWSRVEGRKYVKDLMFTLIVMMLGVYIVSFSQNLSTKVNGLVGIDNATSMSSNTDGTATVTATSAVAITTTTNTATMSSNQDVALYDPVSFDQMWHRLTGRPVVEQEDTNSANGVPVEEKETLQPEVPKEPVGVKDVVDHFTQWISPKLKALRGPNGEGILAGYMKSRPKYKLRTEMQDLHEKLQDYYKDVTANVPKISLSSQKHLEDLVARSQHLLRKTRWAGAKKLEKLIAEQKSLLSHAQHQARHIVSPKKKKRTSFFKRRGGSGY